MLSMNHLSPSSILATQSDIFKHNGDSDVSREDGRRVADECIKQGKIIAGKGYFELTQRSQNKPQNIKLV